MDRVMHLNPHPRLVSRYRIAIVPTDPSENVNQLYFLAHIPLSRSVPRVSLCWKDLQSCLKIPPLVMSHLHPVLQSKPLRQHPTVQEPRSFMKSRTGGINNFVSQWTLRATTG